MSFKSLEAQQVIGFHMILACDSQGGLAKDGELPWHLPEDLRWFRDQTVDKGREATSGQDKELLPNAVIMGRLTWESIPDKWRPLPKRWNIVISRQPDALMLPDGVGRAGSIESAIALAAAASCPTIWIAGGGQIYDQAQLLPGCASIVLTRIDGNFGCNTHFQGPAPGFSKVWTSDPRDHKGVAFRFERWERAGGAER